MTLRWLFLFAAIVILVAGLTIPSFLLICVSMALGAGALLSVVAGRRKPDEGGELGLGPTGIPETPRKVFFEGDERWDRVVGTFGADAKQSRSNEGEETAGDRPVEGTGVLSEFHAYLRAELDSVRAEVSERLENALDAVREAVVDLRETVISHAPRPVDDHEPAVVDSEKLEAAIGRLGDLATPLGTLAETEVTVQNLARDLHSTIASLSARVDDLPRALRPELGTALGNLEATVTQLGASIEPKVEYLFVEAQSGSAASADERLSAQLSELRRDMEVLATRSDTSALENSTREVRTAVVTIAKHVRNLEVAGQGLSAQLSDLRRDMEVLATRSDTDALAGSGNQLRAAMASMGDEVRRLEAALRTSSQQQAALTENLSALKEDVAQLAARVPARQKPVRLEDGQMQTLIEAVSARKPTRPIAKKAEGGAAAPDSRRADAKLAPKKTSPQESRRRARDHPE